MAEKKPDIRFQGFSDEWEQKQLKEMGDTYGGLTGKTKEDFGHGKAQFVTYMNVFTNPVATPEGVDHVEIDGSQNEVKKGDIFFTTSSETPDEVGMSSVWLEDKPNTYLNSFCFGYRPKVKIDPLFSAYLMRSPSMRRSFYFLAQGISRFNISKSKAMEIETSLPNLNEQEKIGIFFKQLDELIAGKEQELEKLRQIRLALLEKMFPSGDSDSENRGGYNGLKINALRMFGLTYNPRPNCPAIRLNGFTEPWKQKVLGEISNSYSGGTPKVGVAKYYGGNIPFIRSGEISQDFTELFITQDGLNNSSAKMVAKGDILYALYGATSGEVSISKNDGAINQAILAIIPKPNFSSRFVCYQLRKLKHHIYNTYLQGGQGNLSAGIITNLNLLFPTYEEQKKIGDFFYNFDELISSKQQEIDKHKTIRHSLFNRMFVN